MGSHGPKWPSLYRNLPWHNELLLGAVRRWVRGHHQPKCSEKGTTMIRLIIRLAAWLYHESFNTKEARRRDFERRMNQVPL